MITNAEIYAEVDSLIGEQEEILQRKKGVVRLMAALDAVGVTNDEMQCLDVRAGHMIAGVWLKRPNYATKQRGEPSDYRRFPTPIYYRPKEAEPITDAELQKWLDHNSET